LSKKKLPHPSLDIVESYGTELTGKNIVYVLQVQLLHTNQLSLLDYL